MQPDEPGVWVTWCGFGASRDESSAQERCRPRKPAESYVFFPVFSWVDFRESWWRERLQRGKWQTVEVGVFWCNESVRTAGVGGADRGTAGGAVT